MKDNNIEQIVSLKSIDQLLQAEKDPAKFQQILTQKKKIFGLIHQKKMTSEKYKSILQLSIKKLGQSDLASDYKFQLSGINDFHDGNVQEWFKQIVEESKDKLKEQEQKLKKLKKAPQKKTVPAQSQNISIPKSTSKYGNIFSLKALDQWIQQNNKNSSLFCELYERKKQIFQLMQKGQINAQKYKYLQQYTFKTTNNQKLKDIIQMDLTDLNQFSDGNVNQWFQSLVNQSGIQYEQQTQYYQKIKGVKTKPNEAHEELINVNKKQIVSQNKNNKQNKFGDINSIFSLKALDEWMLQNNKNPEVFCLLFQRKNKIFQMMQKGQINAQKYKILQQKALKSTSNQQLKTIIQMDLSDIQDLYNNKINEWFESLINETGLEHQNQQQIYKALKQSRASKQQKKNDQSKPTTIKQKPIISELICFTALYKFFKITTQDLDMIYYKQLIDKRQKLIQLIKTNKLIPSKYRQINKAVVNKTQNTFLKSIIIQQQNLLSKEYNNNQGQWYSAISKYLFKEPPQLKFPQNNDMKKINNSEPQQKINYLATRMSSYESLINYFFSNNIPYQQNSYALKYYQKTKRKGIQAIKQIQKDPKFDIYNFTQQLFPKIDSKVFVGQKQAFYKKKVQQTIPLIMKYIAQLKDYSGKIKKGTNSKNLQFCKKQITKCQQNIAMLKKWPGQTLAAFPQIKIQKVQKYNLDLNDHLESNQVQIIINHIQGIPKQCILKIFVGPGKQRYLTKASNGQNNISTIIKLQAKDMNDLYRGQRPLIILRFYEKGFFFGETLVKQCSLVSSFIRNNISQEKMRFGQLSIMFCLKIQKPSKPIIYEVNQVSIKNYPVFKHDLNAFKQLIKQAKK